MNAKKPDLENLMLDFKWKSREKESNLGNNLSYEELMVSFEDGPTEANLKQLEKLGFRDYDIIKGQTPQDYLIIGYLPKGLFEDVLVLKNIYSVQHPERIFPRAS
jgi:hypothetical protein